MALNDTVMAGMPGMQQQPGASEQAGLGQTIARLLQRMAPQHLAQPLAPQQPERSQMMTGFAHNRDEGAQMFAHNLGATIQNAVAAHKEKQIRTAMADYQGLQSAYEQAQMVAGDPNAPDFQQKVMHAFQQSPITQAVLGDPKKMKNMAKAFNQDWLNPEKTTVYGEALKRVQEADKAGKMVKLMRALHLKSQQQPQLNDQQRQQLVQEETSRLPIASGLQATPATATMMREFTSLFKAMEDKNQIVQGVDPQTGKPLIWAVDKAHPERGAVPIEVHGPDGKSKGQLGVAPKGGVSTKTGDIFSVNGKPYGVRLAGRTLSISDFGSLDEKTQTWVTQKLDEANRIWAQGNAEKEKVARIRGEMYNKGREYAVFDRATHQFAMATPAQLAASPGRYGPASQEQSAMTKEGIFQDINYNVGNITDAINNLKHDFTTKDVLALNTIFSTTDPGVAESFLQSEIVKHMSSDQQDLVAAMVAANENALSLRAVGGMGQSSDMVRKAIQSLIPSRGPTQAYARKQLKYLNGTVNRLHQAVPVVQMPRPIPEEGQQGQGSNTVYDSTNIPD